MSRQERAAFAATNTMPIEVPFIHPTGGRSEFIFVRHGRTEGNVRRILVGRTDIPLDDLGYRQAAAVAEHVGTLIRPDVVVASPLLRARETAQAIADVLELPIEIDQDIAELHFGEYEGWSIEDIRTSQPEFAATFGDIEFDIHWPGGERLSEFHQRVHSAVTNLAMRYASHKAVVVSHGGFLGSMAAQLFGTPPNDWSRYQIQNCSVTHLEIATERSIFHRFNDCAHLDVVNAELVR